jgi:hypothetical protein
MISPTHVMDSGKVTSSLADKFSFTLISLLYTNNFALTNKTYSGYTYSDLGGNWVVAWGEQCKW